MDRILIILKKENGPRASSAPALGLNTIIFKHVYWYMQQTQVSVYRTIGPLVLIFAPKHRLWVLTCTHNLRFEPKIKKTFKIFQLKISQKIFILHGQVFVMPESDTLQLGYHAPYQGIRTIKVQNNLRGCYPTCKRLVLLWHVLHCSS